ncbi:phosphoribosyltransferase [Mangrovactinospora gilvigrisea]|uniref:Phosphoribosyltransferase n=1 Tax=Mangrovactinospora gilvigrisea TaxID=1428644 RepID=A0A1J7BIP0_9ACTN|nr:phosphoribosyltransferase [Mangrovactinospora gilvigrisea]OIV38502.1 phosphoribosyltransferase [Mangrovactinospora gilvigrisea]
MSGVWSGEWVERRLGVGVDGDGVRGQVGLAVRRNPRRAHLLVSGVLGKHVPAPPEAVHGAGVALGGRVRELLGAAASSRAVVLGYAETATGLGLSVADGLGAAVCLHSTRRPVAGVPAAGGFEEEHSHATGHLLLPEREKLLAGDGPLVLVDDELSTGRTVRNTLRALHARWPRARYVVAALVDVRPEDERTELARLAVELDTMIDVVSAAEGRVHLPEDVLTRGTALVAEVAATRAAAAADGGGGDAGTRGEGGAAGATGAAAGDDAGPSRPGGGPPAGRADANAGGVPAILGGGAAADASGGSVPAAAGVVGGGARAVGRVDVGWPVDVPDGGRHGFTAGHRARLEAELPRMGAALAAALPPAARRVLVLGTEELMYAPLRLAAALGAADGDREVRFSSTTRSPVLPVDDPGYAVRTRLAFPAHDRPADGPGERYAYNVAPGRHGTPFDAVVAVVDADGDTPELHAPGGLLDRLASDAAAAVHLVVLPSRPPEPLRGPAFGSYAPAEVDWLLTDLSEVPLEAPVEEREEAVQSGGAHYAESLPVEYRPSAEYQALFRAALDASAERLARAVGAVTELVLAERGPDVVLASLARAGTPVGILMRRWAAARHGLDLPHCAVSIVRGRGIDPVALRRLALHHGAGRVQFVDGWTGKGAITRELAAALREVPGADAFDPSVAVLADPGGCVPVFGTREDFLIPSACLNSTVSGLVSRTVLRADLIGPGAYHGAKFYAELAGDDVSADFLDRVSAHFADPAVAADAEATAKRLAADPAARRPDWAGWAAVERLGAAYGIGDVNLIKPGVGETTRVLLRRVPWRVLVRRGAGADLDHVRLLAEQRGVPVEEVDDDDLPYASVGLIHPRYTRGATGGDGRSAAG